MSNPPTLPNNSRRTARAAPVVQLTRSGTFTRQSAASHPSQRWNGPRPASNSPPQLWIESGWPSSANTNFGPTIPTFGSVNASISASNQPGRASVSWLRNSSTSPWARAAPALHVPAKPRLRSLRASPTSGPSNPAGSTSGLASSCTSNSSRPASPAACPVPTRLCTSFSRSGSRFQNGMTTLSVSNLAGVAIGSLSGGEGWAVDVGVAGGDAPIFTWSFMALWLLLQCLLSIPRQRGRDDVFYLVGGHIPRLPLGRA